MPPPDHDPYKAPHQETTRWSLIRAAGRNWGLLLALVTLWLPAAFFYVLATAPYRPPHDMRSLLGVDGVKGAYALAGFFTMAWLVCLFILAARVLRPADRRGESEL